MTMRHQPTHRPRRGGFSFAEVLFAVMILGIGFIMVAAMFPVAIQQSKTNTNQTVAARVAEAMLAVVRTNATDQVLQNTGGDLRGYGYDDGSGDPTAFTMAIMSNVIYPLDPRYGCTVLYRRFPNQNFADVFLVVMQAQNRPAYESIDVTGPTFVPEQVRIVLEERVNQADRVYFYAGDTIDTPIDLGAAVPGAILIVRGDSGSGRLNGKTYRLGRRIDTGTWELQAGWDMTYHPGTDSSDPSDDYVENIPPFLTGDTPSGTPGTAYLVGRGINPDTGDYDGGNQAVAVYTALIPIPDNP